MNKRIKELAEQAGAGWGNLDPSWVDLEKFAELIVRECATVARKCENANYSGTAIEEHFGLRKQV